MSRELVLQGLYEALVASHEPARIRLQIEREDAFRRADQALFRELWSGIHQNRADLESAIAPMLDRALDEVSPIERSVLLLATYELIHRVDIPFRVVINEAVELTKAYGGTDGHKWINGVLDRFAPTVRPHEKRGC